MVSDPASAARKRYVGTGLIVLGAMKATAGYLEVGGQGYLPANHVVVVGISIFPYCWLLNY